MVAKDLYPLYDLGYLAGSGQAFIKKTSSLVVNVEKLIRILQLSSAFYEYHTILCSQMFIPFMHSMEKLVKQTLKSYNIFRSMKWLHNRCYISTYQRVFYTKEATKTSQSS